MPFKTGQSGNPGGRPKDVVGPLARKHTAAAINRLVFWMNSNNAKASVSACIALLDRGYGKPAQALMNPDGSKLTSAVIYLPSQSEGKSGGISAP